MFEAITNKFVPEQKDSSKFYRNKIGIFQGWVSASVNLLLFIFKLFIGLITGAVSLIADAIHTLSDVITCLLYTSPSPRDRQKSRMPSSA